MKIYIDESGTFTSRKDGASAVSCVRALVIPHCYQRPTWDRYGKLRPSLQKKSGEVKGRNLDEGQVSEVIDLLGHCGLIFEVHALDMTLDTEAVVAAHRDGQVRALGARLTPDHSPALRAMVAALQESLQGMPLQLYAQAVALTEVVGRTLRNATLYYV